MVDQALRSTALEAVHESLGATFTDFAGWRMPVRYDSDLAEHRAVRESAGLFDLSHMGEIHLRGPQAAEALDHALSGRLSAMSNGRAKYSLLLTEQGGVIDDLIVYRLAEDHFLVVANASNAEVDAREITARAADFDVEVDDASERTSLLAVQGPESEQILLDLLAAADSGIAGITAEDITSMKYYRVAEGSYRGDPLLVARTGYTGEDGFELYVGDAHAEELWTALTAAGGDRLVPCGLACRDTLRLEAGMPLYGTELVVDVRGKDLPVRVVEMPFYRRG
jgi:aminomethyltransferase